MNSFDNEVFEFGTNPNEETENFNYGGISGLGESNYENEDLFSNLPPIENKTEVNNNTTPDSLNTFDYNLMSDTSLKDVEIPTVENNTLESVTENIENVGPIEEAPQVTELPIEEEKPIEQPAVEVTAEEPIKEIEPIPEVVPEVVEEDLTQALNTPFEMPTVENNEIPEMKTIETTEETSPTIEKVTEEEEPTIEMSETPIEDLQKLTEYEEDKIDSTNINSLFDKLSVNVKDASEIFRKNTNLKEKIDTRFEELKALQGELENSRRKQIEEIDKYRDEVLDKLAEKKAEIEKRLNVLKDLQATLEKEKTEFEEYKRKEQANISKIQKEVQSAYDDRREELEHIEDVLRKQKDSLDEERNQLSLDKIQYEADKNDLANNLLKFNQIVNTFTNGIEMKPEE